MDSYQSDLEQSQAFKYNDKTHIFKVVLNICLASTYSGFIAAYFNTINFDDTIRIFNIHHNRAVMQGLLSFSIFIGAGIGGYVSSYALSYFSRRQCFLFTAYVSIAVTLLLQTKIIQIIFFCRFIQGITVGMSTVFRSVYIKEFVPIELAGQMGYINQLMFSFGLIFTFVQTYILSIYLQPQVYWRIVYLTPILFLVVQTFNLHFNFPYETPKYLLEQGKKQQAQNLIAQIYKPQHVHKRIAELQKIISMTKKPTIYQSLQIDQNSPKKAIRNTKFTTSSNKIAVIAAFHISIIHQIAGIKIIVLYTGQILLKILPSISKVLPIFLQILGFIMTYFGSSLIQKYGRKQLIQKGSICIGLIHLTISLAYLWKHLYFSNQDQSLELPTIIIVSGLIVVRGIYSLTLGPIVWIYVPEIVQSNIVSIAAMIDQFTGAFIAFIFPIVTEFSYGHEIIFALIALIMIIGYVLNKNLLVQTKDRSQWSIRRQYDDKLAP